MIPRRADCLDHQGEQLYVVFLAAWMIIRMRRGAGSSLVRAERRLRISLATLFWRRRWEDGRFCAVFEGGKALTREDDLSELFQRQR